MIPQAYDQSLRGVLSEKSGMNGIRCEQGLTEHMVKVVCSDLYEGYTEAIGSRGSVPVNF